MTDPGQSSAEYRLLIMAPNWLGDSVMATGLLDYLDSHRELPDGRRLNITWAVRSPWAPLFENDPRADQILPVLRPGKHEGILGIPRLASELRSGRYDAALLGPPSLRVALATALAGIPSRIGYMSDGRNLLLSRGLDLAERGSQHFHREMIELGRSFLSGTGVDVNQHALPARTSLPGVSLPVEDPPQGLKRIALAPGATYGLAKTWPLDCALDFCRQCLSEGAELLLLGDKAAQGFARDLVDGLAQPVRSEVEGRPGVVDLTGKTDLARVAGILQTLHGYAGNDSGLMHLAAALEVPTVGIFGSSNPGWTRPLGPFCRAVVAEGFPCHPCYLKTCNQPEFCLASISGQQVYSELRELMKEKEATLP